MLIFGKNKLKNLSIRIIVFSLVCWDLLELINGGKLGNVWGIVKKIQLFKVSRKSITHFQKPAPTKPKIFPA